MDLKKLGFVSTPRGYEGHFIVSEYPKNLGVIPKGISIEIGFSKNFTKKFVVEDSFINEKKLFIIKLKGIDNSEEIVNFKEQAIFISLSELDKFNPDYIFDEELIDCEVYNFETNEFIGKITEVWDMPANPVWLVSTSGGELPIPAIPDFIKELDLRKKKIKLFVMDGLMDLLNQSGREDED